VTDANNTPPGCPELRRLQRLNRRGFLQAGILGAAGLSLPELLRLQARAAQAGQTVERTRSVIILWMRGGTSQHDTWEPKPDAPAEIRGGHAASLSNAEECRTLRRATQMY